MEAIKDMIKQIIFGDVLCLSGVLIYYLTGNVTIFDIMLVTGGTVIYAAIFFYVTSSNTGLFTVRK